MKGRRRVVIVGASAAGITVAEALARSSFDAEVLIIGDEPEIAHDRPPLSKQVLSGEWGPDKAQLLPAARREQLGAEFRLGVRAVALDDVARRVSLDDGTTVRYDELVIATGVRPRRLPCGHPAGVHVVRTLADATGLRAELFPGARLLVIGAGFLGLEVAATVRKTGAEAIVVEPLPKPLASRLGAVASERLLDLHARHGVDVRSGVGVNEFEAGTDGRVTGARLSDGSSVECTAAVVAIGCVPNTEWLDGSSVEIADGVVCDAKCLATPGVWAAGDVARWQHEGLGRDIRIEHRLNATEQGIAVAANIVGRPKAFVPTPYFWTDHYDVKIQVAGIIDPSADEHVETIDGGKGFLHTYRVAGELVAVLGWNAAKAMMPLRRELRAVNAGSTVTASSRTA